jgi:hypothetical protein
MVKNTLSLDTWENWIDRRLDRASLTARQSRLIACAVARHVQSLRYGQIGNTVIDYCERWADLHNYGPVSRSVRQSLASRRLAFANDPVGLAAFNAIHDCALSNYVSAMKDAVTDFFDFLRYSPDLPNPLEGKTYLNKTAHAFWLMRTCTCILCTRRPHSYSETTHRLASCVYYDRDEGLTPILADSLTDDGDMRGANHLRSGTHPRGCFAIDQILGLR